MYEKFKTIFSANRGYCITIVVLIVCIICVWVYTNRSSNIDTSGIRNAENELRHVREYNQQSIEYKFPSPLMGYLI